MIEEIIVKVFVFVIFSLAIAVLWQIFRSVRRSNKIIDEITAKENCIYTIHKTTPGQAVAAMAGELGFSNDGGNLLIDRIFFHNYPQEFIAQFICLFVYKGINQSKWSNIYLPYQQIASNMQDHCKPSEINAVLEEISKISERVGNEIEEHLPWLKE